MSNPIPVTIQGISVSGGNNGGATVLTQSQANQLLQKLRSMQGSGSGSQTIKIQAIQTNPQTGAKQIVAIPVSSNSVANTIQVGTSNQTITVSRSTPTTSRLSSPMKVIKIPASSASAFHQQNTDMPPGVKVVKLSAAPTTTNTKTVYSPQVNVSLDRSF